MEMIFNRMFTNFENNTLKIIDFRIFTYGYAYNMDI